MIIDKSMWESFTKAFSYEALGDEFDTTPEGGAIEGDAEMNESNEQFNESDFSGDDFGSDFSMGGDGLDDFGGPPDMSGGNMGGGSGLGTALNPTENPFKGQNGRTLLDTKLSELYTSVDNSLKLIQSDIRVDKVVIGELTNLLENIKRVREVVFIQPVDTSAFRWALCVKAYQLIYKQLCINTKVEQDSK
jgi:hypothetical protein